MHGYATAGDVDGAEGVMRRMLGGREGEGNAEVRVGGVTGREGGGKEGGIVGEGGRGGVSSVLKPNARTYTSLMLAYFTAGKMVEVSE